MSNEELTSEKLYQTTMFMARKMLLDGIISKGEYYRIDTIFTEKYRSTLGRLFADISLTL